MIKNPLAGFDLSNPFGTDAMKRSRNLFGVHTTPRTWKHGARDIPFGMGEASLYVDGTKGSDSNDGESWITARKTIQETIDIADSWTQIFIKAGTYSEEVDITTARIALIGESRGTTTISDASNVPLAISADKCHVEEITTSSGVGTYSLSAVGDYNAVTRCNIGGSKLAVGGDYNEISHCISNAYGFYMTGLHNTIHNCITDGSGNYGVLIRADSKYNRIFNNDIWNATTTGIFLDSFVGVDPTYNTIFHNNLIGNGTQVVDEGSNNKLFENFYDDHSNVDNGFGIAKAPYAYTGGTDPRPVVTRNGWLGLSWADADLVADILADVTGIAGAAMRGTDNAALASALTTHDGKLDTVDGIVDAILADTTGLNGDAMRGTNSAALASVCTGTRLAELDAANLPTDIDAILADVTGIAGAAMRGTNLAALASVCTETRLAELDAANLPADIDTLLARMCQHHGAAYAELITSGDSANPAINYDTVANNTTIISVPITITERCCIVVNAALLEYAGTLATDIEIERPFGTSVTTQRDNVPTGGLELFHHAAWEVLNTGTYTYYLVNRTGGDIYAIAAWIKAVASDCVGT